MQGATNEPQIPRVMHKQKSCYVDSQREEEFEVVPVTGHESRRSLAVLAGRSSRCSSDPHTGFPFLGLPLCQETCHHMGDICESTLAEVTTTK
jgi:hypothetical protein